MDYTYTKLFQTLVKFNSAHKAKFFVFTLLQIISSTVWLYNIYAVAQLVNFLTAYKSGDSLREIYTILALWLTAVIVRNACSYSARLLSFNAGTKGSIKTQLDAISYISTVDISWHEKENAGNKVKRIQRGADGLNTLTRVWVTTVIDIVINFIGTILIISNIDQTIALTLIVYQILYFLIASTLRKKADIARRAVNVQDEEFAGILFETLNNIRSVKVLGMSTSIVRHLSKTAQLLKNAIRDRIFWVQSGVYLRKIWEGLARVSFITFIVYGILHGQYEIAFLVLFYGYFSTITGSVDELANVAQDLAEARANIGRLTDLFELPVTIDNDHSKVAFPESWSFLTIKDLSFQYGDHTALSHIDFQVKRGEKIGIVGLSGAGKSTLFKLLLKEHNATGGDIYIDDVPVQSIRKNDYLNYVAPVLQETEVFNMSLRRNIELAGKKQDDSLLSRALTTSHVSDFLHKLPQGVDTVIGEKGVKLSGGERQRVGIARAIFKDPQILLLDEATSHLDVESEGKIQDSLHQFFKGITAIVIAHRLSTIKEMDRIIVIENGTIIEQGTFDELHAKDARFREFWDKQSQV